ncbi:hypothetical protein [Streptomyces sp. NBC_00582]|uniref:hypothetical protein n=1 Tax=Streptomyces sp. NBC_00582 TaxID=2975783 RepID=UPI002E80C1F6|nr:hypothetical protein [Streptomyces sp. NBC_00582]WUB62287.1 hypothetical protein OG852_18755 [Streptomyces sp. NBC_00582]
MVRRPVALILALVLFAEAFGIALLNWALGVMADAQNMSMAGVDPDVMSRSSKVGGIVFGLYFAACGVVALLMALRNRAPGVLGRILLISAAVVHALLGALAWGLLGRQQFVFMIVVLGLIVLLLMTYDAQPGPAVEAPGAGGPGDGAPGDGSSLGNPEEPAHLEGPEDGRVSLEKPEEGGTAEESENRAEGDGSSVTPPAAPTAP